MQQFGRGALVRFFLRGLDRVTRPHGALVFQQPLPPRHKRAAIGLGNERAGHSGKKASTLGTRRFVEPAGAGQAVVVAERVAERDKDGGGDERSGMENQNRERGKMPRLQSGDDERGKMPRLQGAGSWREGRRVPKECCYPLAGGKGLAQRASRGGTSRFDPPHRRTQRRPCRRAYNNFMIATDAVAERGLAQGNGAQGTRNLPAHGRGGWPRRRRHGGGHAPVPHRPARRRSRPARRRARRRQDHPVQDLRPRPRHRSTTASSSRPTCSPPTSPAPTSSTARRTSSSCARGRSSARCCWPTRSTGPRQDAVGPARSDAGEPGHHRGDHAAFAAAVHGAGDAEPGRAGRRLPAARGPARPLPAARRMGYPGRSARWPCSRCTVKMPVPDVEPLFTAESILACQSRLPRVHGADGRCTYIVDLAEASRHPDLALGASPRASLCLLRCARAPRPARRPALLHPRGRAGRRPRRARPPPDRPARGRGRRPPRQGSRRRSHSLRPRDWHGSLMRLCPHPIEVL